MTERDLIRKLLREELYDVEPSRLLEFGRQHQLLPLWYLSGGSQADWPEVTESYRHQWLRNMQMTLSLSQLAQGLDGLGVPWLLLKGLPLAQQLYGDLGARAVGDIDILVPRSELIVTLEHLQNSGFQVHRKWLTQLPMTYRFVHAFSLWNEHIRIDLHHEFRSDPALQLDACGIWQRATNLVLEGREYPIPHLTDTIVLLLLGLHDDLGQGNARVRSFLDLQTALASCQDDVLESWRAHGVLKIAVNVLHQLSLLSGRDNLSAESPGSVLHQDIAFQNSSWQNKAWALQLYSSPMWRSVLNWLLGLPFRMLSHR